MIIKRRDKHQASKIKASPMVIFDLGERNAYRWIGFSSGLTRFVLTICTDCVLIDTGRSHLGQSCPNFDNTIHSSKARKFLINSSFSNSAFF
ncbi:hypothetical protein JHK82_053655 [Glycine max]|uniref:Uncharacterized protein n=2 Tax=Glycine subgen. Soja TaxID=1462606 RepID=K7MYG4_SOYBN|nr:hypothetical protein JHK87_053571 [Glycine soja]KAG4927963.1 hypothetical protein JHK85_054449 [Glycine max]KAG5083487.1 hypothetical protein JHK84_053525 [Glycine max]KAG5086258.1 hypothetical protein JHK82_053655 [Glycine max]KAH1077875.1 hypothetical protein GYH30_053096 [Glycine max]